MREPRTPQEAFDRLLSAAVCRMDDGRALDYYRRQGRDIPDRLKPGYLVARSSSTTREQLKGLTPGMTQHRQV